jgi:hypothetical protein
MGRRSFAGEQELVDSVGSPLGRHVKHTEFSESGVIVTSDLSNYTLRKSLEDDKFWHVWLMLTFSLTFCFFMKVAFKSYGSTIYSSDKYLTTAIQYGFFTAAVSRFGWAALGQIFGFKKVYIIILLI